MILRVAKHLGHTINGLAWVGWIGQRTYIFFVIAANSFDVICGEQINRSCVRAVVPESGSNKAVYIFVAVFESRRGLTDARVGSTECVTFFVVLGVQKWTYVKITFSFVSTLDNGVDSIDCN